MNTSNLRVGGAVMQPPLRTCSVLILVQVRLAKWYRNRSEHLDTLGQGFQLWRFRAKVAVLKGPVAPEFRGDSPPKKWRFWKAMAIRQFVAIFGENVAIFGENVAIFECAIKKFQYWTEELAKKWRNLASFWRKSGDFEHSFCGAKSGDFETPIWLSGKK